VLAARTIKIFVALRSHIQSRIAHHITERGWTHLGNYWVGKEPKPGWDAGPVRAFAISCVPTTILIGRDGRIVWRGDPLARISGKDLETRIEETAKE
jgi:hypothetical protein